MNKSHLLMHPQLLGTEDLRQHLKQRSLIIPNIDTLDRNALLKLFHTFAVPRAQRIFVHSKKVDLLNYIMENSSDSLSTPKTSQSHDVDMDPATTVSSLTLDCQNIRISNGRKRPMIINNGETPLHQKRQIITWP